MTKNADPIASLDNPFSQTSEQEFRVPGQIASTPGPYEESLKAGWELQQRPYTAAGVKNIMRQHQKNRMTIWERSRGFEIGSHTINHPILEELPDCQAAKEINDSRDWVLDVTGVSPSTFAYPNGKPGIDFSVRHQTMVAEAGFDAAVSTAWGIGRAQSDAFSIPRVGPWWRGS